MIPARDTGGLATRGGCGESGRTGGPMGREDAWPRLIVMVGDEPGRSYVIDSTECTIGRGEGVSVRIDDTRVSRAHARIFLDEDGNWSIQDMGSQNGTRVNGELVSTQRLNIGDRVQLLTDTLLMFTHHDPLEGVLRHRQEMVIVGQLAAGLAHDFNNLLSVVAASIDQLRATDEATPLSDDDVGGCLEDIHEAVGQAAGLTERLLTIARHRDQAKTVSVRVDDLCSEVLQLARRTLGRWIRVVSDVEPDLVVEGDRRALHQLLMNLCINARDAMPNGGELTVAARLEREPARQLPWSTGPQVVIEVRDTGVGMDEETRTRIFEAFFTTKEASGGSGLGLATVHDVTTSHGGLVEVCSEPRLGTTFRVVLPAAVARAATSLQVRAQSKRVRRSAGLPRVLIVDDQEMVARALARTLRAYEVTLAHDGATAIALANENRYDVIVCDLMMPGTSGVDVYRALCSSRLAERMIFVSGGAFTRPASEFLATVDVPLVHKPVDPTELRELIDRTAGVS